MAPVLNLRLVVSLAVATLLVAACGTREAGDTSTSADAEERPTPVDITCPSGQSGGTDGGFFPEDDPPEGYATPEQAAEVWVSKVYPGSAYVLVRDGLLVLRDDGTATARAFWLEGREDFLVDGYRACVPGTSG